MSLLPKLTLLDVDTDLYTSKDVLNAAILEKNTDVAQPILNGSGSFEIVLIDTVLLKLVQMYALL